MRYNSPSCLLFLIFKLARDGAGYMRVSKGLCVHVDISRMRRQNAHMLLYVVLHVNRICCLLIREFCKRMNPDIPFYYWTRNERYMAFDHDLPSFNERPHNDDDDSDDDSDDVSDDDSDDGDDDPQQHPLRLHRLVINRREDASIFVSGRSFLPARNQVTIRQRLFRPSASLPSCPRDQI